MFAQFQEHMDKTPEDLSNINKLSTMHDRETAACRAIAGKLGFTTPNYERSGKKPGRGVKKEGALDF